MGKIRKLIAAIIMIATLGGATMFGACTTDEGDAPVTDKPTGLKVGFGYGGCLPTESEKCAYATEARVFDADKVVVTFYFGMSFTISAESQLKYDDIPEFDVYFANEKGETIYMIRHSTENFVSEEYRVTSVYLGDDMSEYVFNHSEEITIPQELFTKESGVIRFCVSGVNIKSANPRYKLITGIYISYDYVGEDKIELSRWDGRRV